MCTFPYTREKLLFDKFKDKCSLDLCFGVYAVKYKGEGHISHER